MRFLRVTDYETGKKRAVMKYQVQGVYEAEDHVVLHMIDETQMPPYHFNLKIRGTFGKVMIDLEAD
jgi:hypothetical protein